MGKRYKSLKLGRMMGRMQEISSCSGLGQDINIIALSEMANYLGISTATLRRWVKRREIIGHIAGNGKIYFLKSDFDANFSLNEKMLTCKEVSVIMGVRPNVVSFWIRTGKLVARKYGNKWLITQDDLQDFLDLGFLT
jgi:excisionase family DNA binding protein